MTQRRGVRWRRHAATGAVLGVATVLAAFWCVLPQSIPAMICYEGIGFGAAAVVVISTLRRRPSRTWPWYALAATCALTAAGDFIWDYSDVVTGLPSYTPKLATVAYLAAYPAAVAASIG